MKQLCDEEGAEMCTVSTHSRLKNVEVAYSLLIGEASLAELTSLPTSDALTY